jgi:hypothetical protein
MRGYLFEIDIDATSKADAIGKVIKTAVDCDKQDKKVTKIVSITEAPEDVFNPSN